MPKEPMECENIEDIRAEIDSIDRVVIAMIGRRAKYVHAAAKFKKSEDAVRAYPRFVSMLQQRRAWAEEEGLNPDVIENLYRDLVTHFIQTEMTTWNLA